MEQKNVYYFAIVEGQQQGPYTIDDLRLLHLSETALVWREGWPEWKKLREVAELQELVSTDTYVIMDEPVRAAEPEIQPAAQQSQPEEQPVANQPAGGGYGAQPMQQQDEPLQMPKTHMGGAIFVTIFPVCCCLLSLIGTFVSTITTGVGAVSGCCAIIYIPALVCGIVGLTQANRVGKMFQIRQYVEAEQASKSAGMWVKIGAILIVAYIIIIILSILIPLLFFGAGITALIGSANF